MDSEPPGSLQVRTGDSCRLAVRPGRAANAPKPVFRSALALLESGRQFIDRRKGS